MISLINTAFEHLRMQRLLKGGVSLIFPFLNEAFIGGWRLKEEIQYFFSQPKSTLFTYRAERVFERFHVERLL